MNASCCTRFEYNVCHFGAFNVIFLGSTLPMASNCVPTPSGVYDEFNSLYGRDREKTQHDTSIPGRIKDFPARPTAVPEHKMTY